MMRFAVGGEPWIEIDRRQKLPGRGAYLCIREACVRTALKRRALQTALKAPLCDDDAEALLAAMGRALTQRFGERLSLARRAGRVASGTEPVREAMRRDEARLVCVACDASETTREQLLSNAARKRLAVTSTFEGAQLAHPVGMDYVAAVAITGEPFATELTDLSSSLEDFREAPGGRP